MKIDAERTLSALLTDSLLTFCSVVVSYQQKIEKSRGVEEPYLFRTYKNLHRGAPGSKNKKYFVRNPDLAHDIPIWKVARATSAAPSYFEPAKIDGLKYLDGGFGANNPGHEVYREVQRMNNNSANAIGVLVSIGTGLNDTSGRITDGIGLSRYLNYVNFMKKWATDAEKTHDYLTELIGNKFPYYRLNVDRGIGNMKLDEWKTRGKLRRKLGIAIGKLRAASRKKNSELPQKKAGEKDVDGSSASRGDDDLKIPEWFKPRNKTIEYISEKTRAYLEKQETQDWLNECAVYLVEGRRARVRTDSQRWERACFGTWYQCNRDQCPRGEKEYRNIEELRAHFLDKHRDAFTKRMDESILNKAIDACKVNVQ